MSYTKKDFLDKQEEVLNHGISVLQRRINEKMEAHMQEVSCGGRFSQISVPLPEILEDLPKEISDKLESDGFTVELKGRILIIK